MPEVFDKIVFVFRTKDFKGVFAETLGLLKKGVE
jgi:hypothetical protein